MAIFASNKPDTMKQMRACLASGPELREEFLELVGFMADLNLEIANFNMSFLLDKWVFCADSVNREQRLDVWKEKLSAADFCVMLFWKEISPAVYEELQMALDCLGGEGNLHKLHVFFKVTDSDEPQLRELRKQFAQVYGRHFNVFTSLDELKYSLVNLFLTDREEKIDKHLLVSQFRGRMTLGGNPVANLFRVTCYGKNEVFMRLAAEAMDLRRDLRLLSPESMEYVEKCDRMEGLYTRLDRMVECIWNLSLLEARNSDGFTNKILMKPLKLFHDGKFEKAYEELDRIELAHEAQVAMEQPEENRELLLTLLDAYQAKIDLVMGLENEGWQDLVQELYGEMTQLAKVLHGDVSVEVADILQRWVVFMLTHTEDSDSAVKLAREFSTIRSILLPVEHVKMAEAINLVGEALEFKGSYDDAWKRYRRAYELCVSPTVEGNPWDVDYTTAMICTNLANMASHWNKMRTCLDYEEMALEKLEASCGKYTQQVGRKYESVGLMYLNLGMIDNAYGYLWDSVRIRERLFVGMPTGDLAGAYDAFAQVCSMRKEDGLALEYFEKSLRMTQELFGEYHVNTTDCYTALGKEQLRQGLFSEAEKSFLRVIGIRNMILEEGDELILQGYLNLVSLYNRMGETEKENEVMKKIEELGELNRGNKTE